MILCTRGERREVGTSVGLGQAETPSNRAVGNGRQMLSLLLVSAVLEDRGPHHGRAHACEQRDRVEGAGLVQLVRQRMRLRTIQTRTAELGRPGRGTETALTKAAHPQLHVIGQRLSTSARAEQLGPAAGQRLREIRVDPAFYIRTVCSEFIGSHHHQVPAVLFLDGANRNSGGGAKSRILRGRR